MRRDLRVLRPIPKFQGEEKFPGDIIKAEDLPDVSIAVIDSLISQGMVEAYHGSEEDMKVNDSNTTTRPRARRKTTVKKTSGSRRKSPVKKKEAA